MFKSAAISLVGGLLLRLLFPQQFPPPLSQRPVFIEQIPPEHYLGISVEYNELAKAREDSIQNAVKQIFLQIGAEYQLEFEKLAYSNNNQINVSVTDKFSYSTAGILADVMVKDSYYKKVKGKYMVYTLVYFPQSKIIQARRLIEEENEKRLSKYELFIEKGNAYESQGKIIDALNNYNMALRQAEYLYKEKDLKKALARSNIDNMLSRITLKAVSNYNQRDRHFISCKVFYNGEPVSEIPVRFQLTEGNGFITPLTYSYSDGIVQCDVNVSNEYPSNKIKAWVDIEGVDTNLMFNFSSVLPMPVISVSPLEVRDNCFVFELKESNDVDAVFEQYEVSINAEYKNASFINYYIARVDNSKHASCSFNLLNPIKIKGGSSHHVKIPFNSWVRSTKGELDKWYMRSKLDYSIVLNGTSLSVTVQ